MHTTLSSLPLSLLETPQTPSGPAAPRARPSPAAPPSGKSAASLAKAARNFEAMTIGQLLQPMFATVDTAHGLFGGGNAEAAWQPMLVQAIARHIAANGGLGFAKPVYDALLRAQEKAQENKSGSKTCPTH